MAKLDVTKWLLEERGHNRVEDFIVNDKVASEVLAAWGNDRKVHKALRGWVKDHGYIEPENHAKVLKALRELAGNADSAMGFLYLVARFLYEHDLELQ